MRTLRLTLIFLLSALAVSALAAQSPCQNDYNNSNGPRSLFLNLQNCGTDCAAQGLPYLELYKEGITGVRIAPVPTDSALPPDPLFYQTNPSDPYFVGVMELFGPENVLVLIDDVVDEGPFAKPTPEQMLLKLRNTLDRYPQILKIQFMNEPSNFSGITPTEYVGRYLRPADALVDEYNLSRSPAKKIKIYSAGWFGNESGIQETRRMIAAGGLAHIDVLSAHIYTNRVTTARDLALEYKRLARGLPIAITETNFSRGAASDYDTQQWWICESMAAMEANLLRGLSAEDRALQLNVFYTLRADEIRSFNLIAFEGFKAPAWLQTGPGQFVIAQRSNVPTDPKSAANGVDDGNSGNAGISEDPEVPSDPGGDPTGPPPMQAPPFDPDDWPGDWP